MTASRRWTAPTGRATPTTTAAKHLQQGREQLDGALGRLHLDRIAGRLLGGIDGYSSSSVEQDGTLIECYRGRAYYYSWWEMYPSNAIQVVGSSVSPGDSISSSVVKSGSSYTLKVTDSTHPASSFTTTQTCSSCADTSAEWIAEAPSGASGVYPLSNFHSWSASGASVTSGSTAGTISTFPTTSSR